MRPIRNIAIFASGNGSIAQAIVEYFNKLQTVNVKMIFTNNPNAFVIERAKNLNIPVTIFNRKEFYETDKILNILKENDIFGIVLAGFLWLVSEKYLEAFSNKILNTHPALLPKYGGKGMYGLKVHEEVLRNRDTEHGMTVHLVSSEYDRGQIISQFKIKIDYDNQESVTAENLQSKVQVLEKKFYAEIIEKVFYYDFLDNLLEEKWQ